MPDFVRVRLENGSEASVSAEFAKHHSLTPLRKPAARGGKAIPAKHNPLKKSAASDVADPSKKEN